MIHFHPKTKAFFPQIRRFRNDGHHTGKQDMERQIIHIDVDSFAIAVERVRNSQLRDRPVIMADPMVNRCVVQAISPEARQAGIYRGMLLQQALRLCRDIT
ncbi:MAG TPA: hypothetical protein VGD14_14985, partial [bacterium]